MKILVIALAGIGDTLLATPLIHELRANFPKAQIDAMVLWAGAKDLLEANPHLNKVYQRNLIKENTIQALQYLRSFRANDYDVSINTHPQSRIHYRLAARLIGARVRMSHIYDCSGIVDRFLMNRTLEQDYGKHTVDNNLYLLPLIGKQPILPNHALEIYFSAEDHAWAEHVVSAEALSGKKRLGIHVGSGGTKNLALKRWPLVHYAELLKRLSQNQKNLAVILFGGPEEEGDLEALSRDHQPGFLFHPRTQNLRQAAALIQRCNAFLSVDTALMHVAAAIHAHRQMVIEAPTLNRTNEPYGNPFQLIPNPAVGGRNLDYYRYDGRGIKGTREELLRCMASVSVDSVYQAVKESLE